MGAVLEAVKYFSRAPLGSHGRERAKRPREDCSLTDCGAGVGDWPGAAGGGAGFNDAGAQFLMKLRVVGAAGTGLGPKLCQCALAGPAVENAYGCHYHAYPSESPRDAHGTALCWSLEKSPMKLRELMCLCRLANSCRKDVVLFDGKACIVMQVDIAELEKELDNLSSIKAFDDNVRKGVESIVTNMPNPDEEHNPEEKVRLYTLRCKALLLLPSYSKDSERCCSAALKLRGDRSDLWVLLSECLIQRGANTEACEALDNALRLDSRNEKALSQYSQVLRIRSAEPKLPPQERKKFLSEAVQRAKEAVGVAITSAPCWHLYGIALLSEALSDGVDIEGVRRSLKALGQAARMEPRDPDVRYNKAAVEVMLGNFGNALCDLLIAHEVDPRRLKGVRKQLEDYLSVIRRAISMTESMQRTGKRAYTALVAKLAKHTDCVTIKEAMERDAVSICKLSVGVVDMVSETALEPMVVLAVDRVGEFCLLLFHGLRRGAIKVRDAVVTLSVPKSQPVLVSHDVPAISFLDTGSYSCSYPQVIVDIDSTIINGAPITSQMRTPPQVSTRLFI